MKKLLALFVVAVSCACAQVHTLELGSRGTITLYLLGDWKVSESSIAEQYSLMIKPAKESKNAQCKIEVSFPEVDRFDTKARLKLRVEADCKLYEEESVEGKAYAKEFALGVRGAYGYYCSFTDASLRGKQATKPEDYKVVSAGKIRLTPQILVDVFIGADAFKDEAYQQLLGAIEGMEFTPGRRQ